MRRRASLAAGALVALTIAAYVPALSAGFVWDDDRHVTANRVLDDARGLAAAWTRLDATPQYYPLTHTSFWIEHALWGLDPRGYHATNVLLHVTSAVLLWRLLVLLEVPGAWLAAAVFALHPVHVESVAWISERKNVLSGLLSLAAARAFLGWALRGEGGRRRPALACGLYLAALAAKTVASTLPLALAIVLWWKRGRLARREAAWIVPMVAIGAAFGAVTHHLERTQVGAAGPDWSLSLPAHLALAGRILWFYIGKLLWPVPLIFIYPRWTIDPTDLAAWIGCAAAAVAALAAWMARDRLGRGPAAAAAYYAATLAPALGFFDVYPMRYAFVADHFAYMASLGPIVLACAGLSIAAARVSVPRALPRAAAGALLLVLALRTSARCGAFATEESLWRDTLARNPDAWIAHNDLGILLAQRGANDEAARHFERVLTLRPNHSGARANLGYLEESSGRLAEAASDLARAAAERPDDAEVRRHLARVLLRTGRTDDAVAPVLEAARLRPDDAEVLYDAGTVLAQAGRPREAIPMLEHALALRPVYPEAAANLTLARRAARDVGYPPPPARKPGETPR